MAAPRVSCGAPYAHARFEPRAIYAVLVSGVALGGIEKEVAGKRKIGTDLDPSIQLPLLP
jgi:hypothetical protein